MVTVNDILNFATNHSVFSRKELIASLMGSNSYGVSGTLSEQLNRLVNSGKLLRLKRGIYTLNHSDKFNFSVNYSPNLQRINQQIYKLFPFVEYCLWPGSVLLPYMHHIPNLNFIRLDVEREIAESMFNILSSDRSLSVSLKPTSTEFEQYINTNNTIVIRPLISESPIQKVSDMCFPRIEKILVDIVVDAEFSFLQGIELNRVFSAIFDSHNVNKKRLMRYASRRGKKEELQEILNVNKL